MSHFLTLVLVDADEPDPAEKAGRLMRPFFADDLGVAPPQAKFDGFTIGGRFDGVIWGKEQHYNLPPAEFRARYGLDVVKPADNVRPLSALSPECVPYAVITPDGSWHDGTQAARSASAATERAGLAGTTRRRRSGPNRREQEEQEEQAWSEWTGRFRSLLRSHEGCTVVAFDCHC